MKKIMKTLIMCLFLFCGFIVIGATDITNMNDRKADNEAQQRVVDSNSLHWSRYSVRNSNNKRNKKDAEKWRSKICTNSDDVPKFRNVAVKDKGTTKQKKAWRKFNLKPPFGRAKEIADSIYYGVIEDGVSIASVLKTELKQILQYDTKRIKDPTYKVDYALHVLLNLGPAMNVMFNEKLKNHGSGDHEVKTPRKQTEQKLTITTGHIEQALKSCFDIVKEFGYRLEIAPLRAKNGKMKVISEPIWRELYVRSCDPSIKAIKQQVDKAFDSTEYTFTINGESIKTTYDSIKENFNDEAFMAEAEKKLKEWVELYAKDDYMKYQETVPAMLSKIVVDYHSKASQSKELGNNAQSTEVAKLAINAGKAADKLETKFIDMYVEQQKATMPSRANLFNQIVGQAERVGRSNIRKDKHTKVISMVREHKDKANVKEVTMIWHLSHMSDWKVDTTKKSGITENNHTGAKFLLGPSNNLKIPGSIETGYVRSLKDTQSGMGPYHGDAVGLQLILSPNGKLFTVFKGQKNAAVDKIAKNRVKYKELYTMINVGLGNDPRQPAHLIMGLYTNPALLKDPGMRAPVLKSIQIETDNRKLTPTKPKKHKGKKQGPNSKKNRKNSEGKSWDSEASSSDVVTPEEVKQYSTAKTDNVSQDAARDAAIEQYTAECRQISKMTVKQLKEDLQKKGATVPSRALKADLIEQRMELQPPFELWYKANTTLEPQNSKTTKTSSKKKGNTPKPSRRKPGKDD
tara:strand:- start:6072 stop:8300 length:2229 start_codon:yes stop_codon:yes gene_type:complete